MINYTCDGRGGPVDEDLVAHDFIREVDLRGCYLRIRVKILARDDQHFCEKCINDVIQNGKSSPYVEPPVTR